MPPRRIQTIKERDRSNSSLTLLLRKVKRVVNDCVRLASSDSLPQETMDFCITRLEQLECNLHRARGMMEDDSHQELVQLVQEIVHEFRTRHKADSTSTSAIGYQAQRTEMTKGAPRFAITSMQLQFLVQCGFTAQRMSQLLGVSKRTVERRLSASGFKLRNDFAVMSDAALDELVKDTINQNQQIGPNTIKARLFSRGMKIQRWRIRDAMIRVDPQGSAIRDASRTGRRTYSVAGPNSLWHIDGNHKLIRWRMVIHGGIDGFSRMLVFLRASANNRKETVLGHFISATGECGVPSRIRVDHGGENNDVCDLMELIRGEDRGSAIRGKSVHNQRIERVWVDTWHGATNLFYDVFHFLEHIGLLDVDKEIHLWALHYVYLPRLNQELDDFRNGWNYHPLRTEHHHSPVQLFVGHTIDMANTRLTAMVEHFGTTHQDGDDDVPANETSTDAAYNAAPHDDSHERAAELFDAEEVPASAVQLPDIPCPLSDEALIRLQQVVNPLDKSNELGIDLYKKVISFVDAELST